MQDRQIIEDMKSLTKLMKTCLALDPKRNISIFAKDAKIVIDLSKKISNTISEFSGIPLIEFVYLWQNGFNLQNTPDTSQLDMMHFYVITNIITFKHNDKLMTLGDYVEFTDYNAHYEAIENVRCSKMWTFEKRELYVSFYLEFFKWLSKATHGYVLEAIDFDRTLAKGRLLKFETYVKITNNLLIRERVLAKIFYIGGSRTLEEVFSLKIENVNFKDSTINFYGQIVDYPKHVFDDIKEYIHPRKKGFVFISREGNQIDPTVPYRALKLVTNKMDLDKSFTFMDFMKSA